MGFFKRIGRKWVICDLDGTLCDTSWRAIHAQNKDWGAFHSGIPRDVPNPAEAAILRMCAAQGIGIILVTGRPQEYADMTVMWLHKNDIPWEELFMREDGDKRSDVEVKREVYEKNLSALDILFVLEDRDGVVNLWRSLGLRCFQVQKGNY